ncbi:DUF4176 domain-containing protein [Clostridiales bacterium]|nr:DUF4176 domain-containing protein [Clostridiales bacterium]
MARINYLPLGSVVLLNGGSQKLIIIGRALSVTRGGKEFYFDYGGVLHPQGLINNEMAYFNHDDIHTVYFTGYNDEGTRDLTEVINDYVESHPDLNRCTIEEWEEAGAAEE